MLRLVVTVLSQPPAVTLSRRLSQCSYAFRNTSWEMSSACVSLPRRRTAVL